MSLVGGTSYGCSTARNKGTCANRRTIKRRELEKVDREIRALVEAVKHGAFSTALQRELTTLEARHLISRRTLRLFRAERCSNGTQ